MPQLVDTNTIAVDRNDPGWRLDQGTGIRTFTKHVDFNPDFTQAPKVVVGIAHFDIDNGGNARLKVRPLNVTNEGFDLVIETWANTIVYGVSAFYFAHLLPQDTL